MNRVNAIWFQILNKLTKENIDKFLWISFNLSLAPFVLMASIVTIDKIPKSFSEVPTLILGFMTLSLILSLIYYGLNVVIEKHSDIYKGVNSNFDITLFASSITAIGLDWLLISSLSTATGVTSSSIISKILGFFCASIIMAGINSIHIKKLLLTNQVQKIIYIIQEKTKFLPKPKKYFKNPIYNFLFYNFFIQSLFYMALCHLLLLIAPEKTSDDKMIMISILTCISYCSLHYLLCEKIIFKKSLSNKSIYFIMGYFSIVILFYLNISGVSFLQKAELLLKNLPLSILSSYFFYRYLKNIEVKKEIGNDITIHKEREKVEKYENISKY